jgi:hypothetical protein
MEVNSQLQAPALHPWEPQEMFGYYGEKKCFFGLPEIEPRPSSL